MRRAFVSIFSLVVCMPSAFAESLLTAQPFPKTFNDLSFKSRMDFMMDDYSIYESIYDENGVCISGCAYPGITLKEDMQAIEEATNEMANLIQMYENTPNVAGGGGTPNNGSSSSSNSNGQQNAASGGGTPNNGSSSSSNSNGQQNQNSESASNSDNNATYTTQDWCRNGKFTVLPLRYPVDMSNFKYRLSGDFGLRTYKGETRLHPAVDIACPVGTPVYATADGVVSQIWYDKSGGGYTIEIKHAYNLMTQYLHLKNNSAVVSAGQRVSACQQIALSGDSGAAEGAPHLDYRVRFTTNAGAKTNKFVDILCPRKAAMKGTTSGGLNSDLALDPVQSLFKAKYKFKPYNPNTNDIKRSKWRVQYGHCMKDVTDLLPDEVK